MKECFGNGSIKNLEKILHKNKIKSIFLVTGKKSYQSSGAEEKINPLLKNYKVIYFSDFETNPKLGDVEKGISLFRKNNCDIVIAVGGGSVIDMGKLINVLAAQDGKAIGYIKNEKIKNKGKIFVAIPTTSGSGAEATHFAVVYVDKIKYSVDDEYVLPDYCIVDPELTMNLPSYITASAGMDALAQAIESYWCINSTKTSKAYAKKAIKLALENISKAVHNPSKDSRTAMAKAAHLAGKAINITKTTAPHAISYPITSYFGIPHGHAVGLTLGRMLVYNSQVNKNDITDKRGVEYVKKTINELIDLLQASDADSARDKITELMGSIGLKTQLSELGLKEERINTIIESISLERMKNNPRHITTQNLKEILKEGL